MMKIDGITYEEWTPDKEKFIADDNKNKINKICECEYMEVHNGQPMCPLYLKNCGLVICDGDCECIKDKEPK